jgi:DNA invertase Pin-like site-specific DNA recombinase
MANNLKAKDNTRKAIGYVRVSSEEQAREGLSIEAQIKKIQAYCDFKELELVAIIKDEAVSGFKPLEKRPGGKELLDAIANNKAQNIIAVKLDRLFRNTGDAIAKSNDFQSKQIDLHLLDIDVDTSTATGRIFFTIIAGLAQFERDITGERTKAVLDMKRKEGKAWNHTPFGFDRLEGDNLTVNNKETTAIKQIAKMRKDGLTLREIAHELELQGIKPKQGKTWHAKVIRDLLLRNESLAINA